jgi:hypothetical protein
MDGTSVSHARARVGLRSKTGLAARLVTPVVVLPALVLGWLVSLPGVAPAPGDRFKLFDATSYGSSFSSIILPSLEAPLTWTNKLLVDGSIEVVRRPPDVYVTSRYPLSPSPVGPNPDGSHFEFMLLRDSAAKSAAVDAPPRDGSRAYLSSTTLTDPNAGSAVVPTFPIPGAVYQLDYTFNSLAGNINTDAVLSVSCTNATLSVSNTDKFQA